MPIDEVPGSTGPKNGTAAESKEQSSVEAPAVDNTIEPADRFQPPIAVADATRVATPPVPLFCVDALRPMEECHLVVPSMAELLEQTPLCELGADPALTDYYLGLIECGRRDCQELRFYSQVACLKEDPLGDYALATRAKTTPVNMMRLLLEWDGPLQEAASRRRELAVQLGSWLENPADLEERALNRVEPPLTGPVCRLDESAVATNPIRWREFHEMLTQVMVEEGARGAAPRLGEPHDWSDQFKRNHLASFSPLRQVSKPLVALVHGETWRYMATGTEKDLLEWVLAQPSRSITFEALFRQSYRLNEGDVYMSLLTIENLMAKHWKHPQRGELAVTHRLARITNIDPEGGDMFGHWYHLVGIMLYGYLKGGARATAVGDVETVGSLMLSQKRERQETFVNHAGGRIGAALRRTVETWLEAEHPSHPEHLETAHYLNLVPIEP